MQHYCYSFLNNQSLGMCRGYIPPHLFKSTMAVYTAMYVIATYYLKMFLLRDKASEGRPKALFVLGIGKPTQLSHTYYKRNGNYYMQSPQKIIIKGDRLERGFHISFYS